MTAWKYQFRAFTEQDPTDVRSSLDASDLRRRDQNVTDTYVVGTSDTSVRVRDGQIKMKGPKVSVDVVVDEVLDERHYFPVESSVINNALGVKGDLIGRTLKTNDDLTRHAARKRDVVVTDVKKTSAKYEGAGLEVEVTTADLSGKTVFTVCVASDDVGNIHNAMHQHGITGIPGAVKMEYAEAIRTFGS